MNCNCRYCKDRMSVLFVEFEYILKHSENGLDDLRKARVYIDELIRQEEANESPS